MFQLYPHQHEMLDALTKACARGANRALAISASGTGKTVTVAHHVRIYLEKNVHARVLYLCHQNDILEEARATFETVIGQGKTFGTFTGQEKEFDDVTCLFASFRTMSQWRDAFESDEFDYIVVDESHHGAAPTYRPTINYFDPQFLVGITATPERRDLQDIELIFGEPVYELHLADALAQQILTPVDYRLMTDEIQLSRCLETPIGKLNVGQLNRILFVPKRDEEIAAIIMRHAEQFASPRTMIFCPSIEYCDRLACHLKGAMAIHSGLPEPVQKARLAMFKHGGVRTVLTVDKFNEGIDVPEANVIVFLRSTQSQTVFFQQLGRGLRRVPGKEKVLVLDFVANCERLQLVDQLWRDVDSVRKSRAVGLSQDFVTVDIGKVHFDEVIVRVLDVLQAIKTGHTKELVIRYIREMAARLGHSPRTEDMDNGARAGLCCSSHVVGKLFGTFNKGVQAAGLQPFREIRYAKEYSRDQLISQLQMLGRDLGRTPEAKDVKIANKTDREIASEGTFARKFGSFHKAQVAAGFVPTRREVKHWTDEEMLAALKRLADKLEHTPTQDEINAASKRGECPAATGFFERFGNFEKVYKQIGLKPNATRPGRPNDAAMIAALKELGRRLGHTPTFRDIAAASTRGECVTGDTYRRCFGSINNALLLAGYSVNQRKDLTREELIRQLREYAKRIGRVPSSMDLRLRKPDCAAAGTFAKYFGSWPEAVRAAGLLETV